MTLSRESCRHLILKETSTYTTVDIEVPAGVVILFYTDGLSDRANPSEDLTCVLTQRSRGHSALSTL